MSCGCQSGQEMWRAEDGMHLDMRGLEPPQPMVKILGLIDHGQAEPVMIVHFDHEPIFLYPELDDRGWGHELLTSSCDDPACAEEVRVRLVCLRP
jgi:hypothetical protein